MRNFFVFDCVRVTIPFVGYIFRKRESITEIWVTPNVATSYGEVIRPTFISRETEQLRAATRSTKVRSCISASTYGCTDLGF